jgi:hypothetical protein
VSLQFPALLAAGAPRVRFSSSDASLTEMLSAIPSPHTYYFCQSLRLPFRWARATRMAQSIRTRTTSTAVSELREAYFLARFDFQASALLAPSTTLE